MITARDAIFAQIKAALATAPPAPPAAAPSSLTSPGSLDTTEWRDGEATSTASSTVDDAVVTLFAERCGDYGAAVVRVPSRDAATEAARLLADHGVESVVAPEGIGAALLAALANAGIRAVGDTPPLSAAELDQLDGVVTACRVAIAETGTLVLDHAADQGRRALSLVPDTHLCLVRAEQIVAAVPQAVTRLRPSVAAGRPLTWVSGPSATVDIELTRVEGVHGPRTLLVVVAE
ncbi:MAG: LUD domain-containing protein [Bifidobacteriaceae bacterium]|nr:LUD domain-containing protein [Bifidobacteriaceae bacterium]